MIFIRKQSNDQGIFFAIIHSAARNGIESFQGNGGLIFLPFVLVNRENRAQASVSRV
jgi:hypothetical protein